MVMCTELIRNISLLLRAKKQNMFLIGCSYTVSFLEISGKVSLLEVSAKEILICDKNSKVVRYPEQ